MHTSEAKSILTFLFARLDSGKENREMVEMEVRDTQGPEQGTLYFMTENGTRMCIQAFGILC